jgi:hypothetical protein
VVLRLWFRGLHSVHRNSSSAFHLDRLEVALPPAANLHDVCDGSGDEQHKRHAGHTVA